MPEQEPKENEERERERFGFMIIQESIWARE